MQRFIKGTFVAWRVLGKTKSGTIMMSRMAAILNSCRRYRVGR